MPLYIPNQPKTDFHVPFNSSSILMLSFREIKMSINKYWGFMRAYQKKQTGWEKNSVTAPERGEGGGVPTVGCIPLYRLRIFFEALSEGLSVADLRPLQTPQRGPTSKRPFKGSPSAFFDRLRVAPKMALAEGGRRRQRLVKSASAGPD